MFIPLIDVPGANPFCRRPSIGMATIWVVSIWIAVIWLSAAVCAVAAAQTPPATPQATPPARPPVIVFSTPPTLKPATQAPIKPLIIGAPSGAATAGELPTANLSFVKNIAPILVTKCAKCHISAAKGKFSMATFESLKKGAADGPVFTVGKGTGSRMVDLIETGDMPRAGPKVTKPEVAAITKWIDEGAKFDGPNEKAPLVSLVGGANLLPITGPKAEEPKLEVVKATGQETIQFSRDIAPVLVENCFVCHSGPGPTGNFQMATFAQMVRGGQSGNPWAPSNPAESLIIKKLKGTAGARMPQPKNKPPLPAETIAKFEKWISEGAHFDGPDPKQSTELLAALVRAKSQTNAELTADRLTAAKRMWSLADPEDKPTARETKDLVIISNLPEGQFNDVATVAQQQATAMAKQFHVPADQPLVKGRVTLFVFPTHYFLSEFGRMVQKRQVPSSVRGDWKFDTINAYAAVLPPPDETDYSLGGLIAQQLASVYVASLPGQAPDWFCEGSGRVIALRQDGKADRVRQWNERLHQLAVNGRLASFISHGLPPEDANVAAYGFTKELMSSFQNYSSLITALRKGEEFGQAFARIYGGPPQTLVTAWAKTVH